jgi:hypothetical protein
MGNSPTHELSFRPQRGISPLSLPISMPLLLLLLLVLLLLLSLLLLLVVAQPPSVVLVVSCYKGLSRCC